MSHMIYLYFEPSVRKKNHINKEDKVALWGYKYATTQSKFGSSFN